MQVHSFTGADADDDVDDLIDFWRQANPDLDVVTKALAMRLRRTAHLYERAVRQELGAQGLEVWEVEMLLALRRSPGERAGAGALMRAAQVTSGAITNRLGRLEAAGWIRRETDPADRRQVVVTLTPEGRARSDRILAAKNSTEQRFFGRVDRSVLERLAADLKTLMGAQGEDGPEPGADRPS